MRTLVGALIHSLRGILGPSHMAPPSMILIVAHMVPGIQPTAELVVLMLCCFLIFLMSLSLRCCFVLARPLRGSTELFVN